MSRIAKMPVIIPVNVEIELNGQNILIRGKKGTLRRTIHEAVHVQYSGNQLTFTPHHGYVDGWKFAGTMRSLLNSIVIGVTDGFIKRLQLVGVGYRASIEGNVVNLSLGFSHPIRHVLPKDVIAECPSQTEIVLQGIDKQVVGQIAADLRAYRRPEPYKGKGIRYVDEIVRMKEAKKK